MIERVLAALPIGDNAKVAVGVATILGIAYGFKSTKKGTGYDSMADKRAAQEVERKRREQQEGSD